MVLLLRFSSFPMNQTSVDIPTGAHGLQSLKSTFSMHRNTETFASIYIYIKAPILACSVVLRQAYMKIVLCQSMLYLWRRTELSPP